MSKMIQSEPYRLAIEFGEFMVRVVRTLQITSADDLYRYSLACRTSYITYDDVHGREVYGLEYLLRSASDGVILFSTEVYGDDKKPFPSTSLSFNANSVFNSLSTTAGTTVDDIHEVLPLNEWTEERLFQESLLSTDLDIFNHVLTSYLHSANICSVIYTYCSLHEIASNIPMFIRDEDILMLEKVLDYAKATDTNYGD